MINNLLIALVLSSSPTLEKPKIVITPNLREYITELDSESYKAKIGFNFTLSPIEKVHAGVAYCRSRAKLNRADAEAKSFQRIDSVASITSSEKTVLKKYYRITADTALRHLCVDVVLP
jgi:hypothetical protein